MTKLIIVTSFILWSFARAEYLPYFTTDSLLAAKPFMVKDISRFLNYKGPLSRKYWVVGPVVAP